MSDPNPISVHAKSGLSKAALAESFLVSLYRVLAPYRGCGHGCVYCDGRAEKYYVEGDFERDIAVRQNIVELVRSDLAAGKAAAEYGALCFGSGVTDVYQPLEARLGLTRRLLENLLDTGLPVVILTKNALVRRDYDLLRRFPHALVIFTVTTLDPGLAAWLEPGASTPAERLAALREAREAGFSAGIMAMPLCPGLTDSPEQVENLFIAAGAHGAQFAYPGGLTLRPGRQKDLFIDRLTRNRPDLLGLYQELYRENRPSGMPLAYRGEAVQHAFMTAAFQAGLAPRIPWEVYKRLLSPPDSLFVLYCHLEELYSCRGIETAPLRLARSRYAEWLKTTRTGLRRAHAGRRRSSRPEQDSDSPFLFAADHSGPTTGPDFPITDRLYSLLSERLESILENPRLAALSRGLLSGASDFDYTGLKPR